MFYRLETREGGSPNGTVEYFGNLQDALRRERAWLKQRTRDSAVSQTVRAKFLHAGRPDSAVRRVNLADIWSDPAGRDIHTKTTITYHDLHNDLAWDHSYIKRISKSEALELLNSQDL